MLRDAARKLLRGECTTALLREAWGNETGRVPGLWKTLADNGLLGVAAPEEHGGLGLGILEVCLLLEEAGYVALPEPLVEVAAVTVPYLAARAPDKLSAVIAGECLVLINQGEPLSWADQADEIVGGTAGVPLCSVDGSRRLWDAGPSSTGGFAPGGVVGVSAMLVGLGRRMLDMAVDYAGVRRQFGRAIGSFQAVQHHLVDARLALDFAAPLVWRAAWSLDNPLQNALDDLDPDAHASMAKMAASEAALTAARKALQVHGAIGYTTEYDLHLFMKRTWALAHTFGTAQTHRALLALHLSRNHA
jgi:alkylation response protein AidB-like acyl-CoA dehydrogenase